MQIDAKKDANCPSLNATSVGQRIDVSGLAPGKYFVRIGDKVSKFVKI